MNVRGSLFPAVQSMTRGGVHVIAAFPLRTEVTASSPSAVSYAHAARKAPMKPGKYHNRRTQPRYRGNNNSRQCDWPALPNAAKRLRQPAVSHSRDTAIPNPPVPDAAPEPAASAPTGFQRRVVVFDSKLDWLGECTGTKRPLLIRTALPGIGRVYYVMEEPATVSEMAAMLCLCWEHVQANWNAAYWCDCTAFSKLLQGEVSAPWKPLPQETLYRLENEYPKHFEMTSTFILDVPVGSERQRELPRCPSDVIRLQHMTKLRSLRPRAFYGYRKWRAEQHDMQIRLRIHASRSSSSSSSDDDENTMQS